MNNTENTFNPQTNILIQGMDEVFQVDQTVGEITLYDLLDEHGFLFLTTNGQTVVLPLDKILCMVAQ